MNNALTSGGRRDRKTSSAGSCSKHGYKAAIVAIAHRLLRIIWSMLRTSEDFDVKRLGVEEGIFELVVKKRFRLRSPRRREAPEAVAAN